MRPENNSSERTNYGLDVHKANPARMYDYWLGGKDSFPSDRTTADKVEEVFPNVRRTTRQNRTFLQRVVTYLAGECGISQFLDIGSGLPSAGNVHEIAQGMIPDARVVYVDHDEVVVAHGRALLATNSSTRFVAADARDPESIIEDPTLQELFDPDQPVAVLMIALLHFIDDRENPHDLLRRYRAWMPRESCLAASHVISTSQVEEAATRYAANSSAIAKPRRPEEITKFFGDFVLVAPGLVPIPAWRPLTGTAPETDIPFHGGVALKTGAAAP